MNQEYYLRLIQKDLLQTTTDSEKNELSKWKAANSHLYDAIYKAWEISEDFGTEIKVDAEADFDKMFTSLASQPQQATKVVSLFSRRKLISIAASVALFITAGTFLFNQNTTPSVIHIVAHEDNQLISLPDQSQINMQKGSSISYAENFLEDRKINLNGSAYFDVKHSEGAKFTVVSPHYNVEVLGTKFLVDDSDDHLKPGVQLIEGKIAVTQHSNKEMLILKPRERVMIEEKGQIMEKINNLKLDDFQWYEQSFSFNENSVSEVIEQLEQFFGINVEVSSTIVDCHFSGDLRGSEAHQILADLTTVFKGQLIETSGNYKITGGKCQ